MLSEAGVRTFAEIIPCLPDADNADVGSFFGHLIWLISAGKADFMPKKLQTLLTIAGSDPMGGAGVQADLRVGQSMGLHVMSAITAVTVQNSKNIAELGVVDPSLLKAQLFSILEDVIPDAIKIGMVGSQENFKVISDFLKLLPSNIPVVIDPILVTSIKNVSLIEGIENDMSFSKLYKRNLFPFATVITPNLKELKAIRQIDNEDLRNILEDLQVRSMIITGVDSGKEELEDILILPEEITKITHPKISCKNLHGTGCVYSSFLASCLALKYSIKEAFYFASSKIYEIIGQSCCYSLGNSSYGPLNINNYKL